MNSSNKQNLYKHILNCVGIYILLSFAACFMEVFRKLTFGYIDYKFLIWNLFLAWIPLILSISIGYIYAFHKRSVFRKIYLLFLGLIWVAVYPNCPYIITDYIHLSGIRYYISNIGYTMNFILWYDFIMISLFILTGFLLGFISLYMVQTLLTDRFNKWIGSIFVGGVLFLSSFGIYLGRFIRWNSWDIVFKPKILIDSILNNSNVYAVEFTISFGLFLILIYFALNYLTKLNEYKIIFHKHEEINKTEKNLH